MSNLDDPRVLFAAERTLMAWSRTAAGLMAFGFVVDRTACSCPARRRGAAFALMDRPRFRAARRALSVLSIVQYRRSVATLRPVEIPPGYWVNLSVYASAHHRPARPRARALPHGRVKTRKYWRGRKPCSSASA